jgi:hypothetical protein
VNVTIRTPVRAQWPFSAQACDDTMIVEESRIAAAREARSAKVGRGGDIVATSSTGPGPDNHVRLGAATVRLSLIGIVVLAIVVAVFLLMPRSDTGSPPDAGASATPEASTPTVEPTSTPEPTPEPVAAWTGLTWSDPVTPSFVVHVYDLLPWGDGYVAVGEVPGPGPWAALTSSDGLHWTVAQRDFPGAPRHLAALGDELFAFMPLVGRSSPPGTIVGAPPTTLIWRSTDGAAWTLVDSLSWEEAWHDAIPGVASIPDGWGETQYDITVGLVDVASGPDGLVAIGNSFSDGGLAPIVLHSTDGQAWSKVSLLADSASPLLNAVVSYAGGYVLAGDWYSGDGTSWVQATVNLDETLFPDGTEGSGYEMGAVAAGADGLVGWMGMREITVGGPRWLGEWTSTDGRTWQGRDANTYPPSYTGHVASDGVRIVAFPDTWHPDTGEWSPIAAAWVSLDGVTWTEMALSAEMSDRLEAFWVVPDGVIYAGAHSFWFGAATTSP